MIQEILFYIVFGFAAAMAIYLLVRAFRKPEKCAGCGNCPLADGCEKKKSK